MLGDVEPSGDLVGAEMLVEEQEDLELSGRKLLGNLVRDPADPAAFPNTVQKSAGDRAGERRLTIRDAAEELGDALGRLALEKVAGGPRPDRLEQVLVRPGGGEDHDLASGEASRTRGRAVRPSIPGIVEVEEDEVRLELAG